MDKPSSTRNSRWIAAILSWTKTNTICSSDSHALSVSIWAAILSGTLLGGGPPGDRGALVSAGDAGALASLCERERDRVRSIPNTWTAFCLGLSLTFHKPCAQLEVSNKIAHSVADQYARTVRPRMSTPTVSWQSATPEKKKRISELPTQ